VAYEESTQKLCSIIQPCVPESDVRHRYGVQAESSEAEDEAEESDPRVMSYPIGSGEPEQKLERCGVHHIVQGWIQRAQPEKVSTVTRSFCIKA